MRVLKIWRGYRKIGPSCGLSSFFVDFGFGLSLTPEELLTKLDKEHLFLGATIVLRNSPVKEKGVGILVEGLKSVNLRVEVEESGRTKDPLWFPKVDRWVVDWSTNPEFNYNALRPRQDLLLCRDITKLTSFIEATSKMRCLLGVISNSPDNLWEAVKNTEVRVYGTED